MTYRWIDHTSEVELLVEAADERAVYAEAVAAVAELLGEGAPGGATDVRRLSGRAGDRATRLAELLGELTFHAEVEGFLPLELRDLAVEGDRFEAEVAGRPGSPSHLVKAVTLHRLSFEPHDDGFRATVVLDV